MSYIVSSDESNYSFSTPKTIEITFCYAQKWMVKMYEKLGWIALGQYNGYNKTGMYIKQIELLIASIEKKRSITKDADRISDLSVILKNVKKLKDFATKLFDENDIVSESNTEDGIATKVTMKWLSKWHAMLYSKLGWMALVKSEGKKYKVKCYLRFINDLIASGKKKINELTDPDNITDAKIIYNNSLKLKIFAEKLLL